MKVNEYGMKSTLWMLLSTISLCLAENSRDASNRGSNTSAVCTKQFYEALSETILVCTSVHNIIGTHNVVCASLRPKPASKIGCYVTSKAILKASSVDCSPESALRKALVCTSLHQSKDDSGSVVCSIVDNYQSQSILVNCFSVGGAVGQLGTNFCTTVYKEDGQSGFTICAHIKHFEGVTRTSICANIFNHIKINNRDLCYLVDHRVQSIKSISCSFSNGGALIMTCPIIAELEAQNTSSVCIVIYTTISGSYRIRSIQCTKLPNTLRQTGSAICNLYNQYSEQSSFVVCISVYLLDSKDSAMCITFLKLRNPEKAFTVCSQLSYRALQTDSLVCNSNSPVDLLPCTSLHGLEDGRGYVVCNILLRVKVSTASFVCSSNLEEERLNHSEDEIQREDEPLSIAVQWSNKMISFQLKYDKVCKKQTEGNSLSRICWILISALCAGISTSNDYFSERRIDSDPFFNVLNPEGTINLFVSTSVVDNSNKTPMVCTRVSEQHRTQKLSRIGCAFTENLVGPALPEKCAIAYDESGLFGSVVCYALHQQVQQTGSVLCSSVYSQHSLVVLVDCVNVGMTLEQVGPTFCERVYDLAGQKMIAVCTTVVEVFRIASSYICVTVFDHDLQKSYKLCKLERYNVQEAKSLTCTVASRINGKGIGIVCQLISKLKAKVEELSCFISYDLVHNTGYLHCDDVTPGLVSTGFINCTILEEKILKTAFTICINAYSLGKSLGTSVCLHAFNQDSATSSNFCTEIINVIKQFLAIHCKRQQRGFQKSVTCKTHYVVKDASEKMECNSFFSINSLKGWVSCELQKKEFKKPVEPDKPPKPEQKIVAIHRKQEKQEEGFFSSIFSYFKNKLYDLAINRFGMSEKVIQCIHAVWNLVSTLNVFALYDLVEKC
ncbi:hypothetical protein BgiMline_030141, partial [Biomphalaria glabrata]